ncbi:unnamed protein product [Paramecium pentaurelia]|uniref:Uncharacterized protein n=1 Tax=Paramecium pentaurelia TaxID=43138 RepID=A0A8S1VF55_9CILI|nr:unnamed protein product [Paramecium pentaurelia]
MDMNREPMSIKLVVIGDGSVGKTCILLSYTTDKFPTEYVPTVFENYITSVSLDGKQINLSLWDTAGQETYDKLRTLSYSQADVFLIVFSVVDRTSFDNAKNKWYPELSEGNLKNIPKIIVGNKIDCRNSTADKHIQFEEASRDLKSQELIYKECSALTQEGLKELFEEAIKQGYEHKQKNPQNKNQQDQKIQDSKENCCCNAF